MTSSARVALLGHFRSRWVASPYPMVVHTPAEGPMTLCAAPSLWMGARVVANALRDAGAQPGDVVACTEPHGPAWVQTLVGTARARCAYGPVGHPARWIVDPALQVRSHDADAPRADGIGLRHETTLRWVPWQALPFDAEAPHPAGHTVAPPSGWHDHDTFLAHVLPALVAGAELHTPSV